MIYGYLSRDMRDLAVERQKAEYAVPLYQRELFAKPLADLWRYCTVAPDRLLFTKLADV